MDTVTLLLAWSGMLGSVVALLWKRYDAIQTEHARDIKAAAEEAVGQMKADRDWIWDKFWQQQDAGDKRLDVMEQGILALRVSLEAVQTGQATVLEVLRREQRGTE